MTLPDLVERLADLVPSLAVPQPYTARTTVQQKAREVRARVPALGSGTQCDAVVG